MTPSALQELGAAAARCTTADRTVAARPRVGGLAADAVVVEYELAGGLLIAGDEATAAHEAQSIAGRLAALPAAAVGAGGGGTR